MVLSSPPCCTTKNDIVIDSDLKHRDLLCTSADVIPMVMEVFGKLHQLFRLLNDGGQR